uniref:Sulfotransferase domain-containing protein n=1 Tax=Haptolina ericina TaxID=156174 RepID=A0A7S3C4L5_9EUKA
MTRCDAGRLMAASAIVSAVALWWEASCWYKRGRMISCWDFVITVRARVRMQKVIRRMLPLWVSRFDGGGAAQIKFTSSDVIVFTPPKSGTTWVTHMCHQIRTHGGALTFEDQDDVVPWIDRLGTAYLRGTRFNDEPDAPHEAAPRVFKSHAEWKDRPQGTYKQVWVFRDAVDMMVSVSRFLPSLWAIERPLSEAEMCSFLLHAGDVEAAISSLVAAWDHRHDERLLILFYEDILEDHLGTVSTLARFMDVSLTPAELKTVVEQTTQQAMLNHHLAFACVKQARNAYAAEGLALDPAKLTGKVRRPTGGKPVLPEGVRAAVGRAWQHLAAQSTGCADYAGLRAAKGAWAAQ